MSNIPNDVGLLLGFRAAGVGLDRYWAFSSYLCVSSTGLSPTSREGELGWLVSRWELAWEIRASLQNTNWIHPSTSLSDIL